MNNRHQFISSLLLSLSIGSPLIISSKVSLVTGFLTNSVNQELNAETAEFYFNRGVSKNEIGDYSEAILDFNKTIELNPYIGTPYFHRGVAKLENGNHLSALEDFTKAIKYYPSDSFAYYNRGLIKATKLDDFKGAISDYSASIKINPAYPWAYFSRAMVWMQLKNHKKAIDDFTQAIYINKNSTSLEYWEQLDIGATYYNRGIAKWNIGDKKGLCKDLKKSQSYGFKYPSEDIKDFTNQNCN